MILRRLQLRRGLTIVARPRSIAEMVASIPVQSERVVAKPRPNGRKPTDARVCECGATWFAKTSGCWSVIVDAGDGQWLRDYKWSAHGKSLNKPFYAMSPRYRRETGLCDRLHQVITGHVHKMLDHINGNGLDNRRSNLRPCTNSQNQQNRKAQNPLNRIVQRTSKHKGVSWQPHSGLWQARITVDGRVLHLGFFGFADDAAICYDYHAAHLHGEFAKLNTITPEMCHHDMEESRV